MIDRSRRKYSAAFKQCDCLACRCIHINLFSYVYIVQSINLMWSVDICILDDFPAFFCTFSKLRNMTLDISKPANFLFWVITFACTRPRSPTIIALTSSVPENCPECASDHPKFLIRPPVLELYRIWSRYLRYLNNRYQLLFLFFLVLKMTEINLNSGFPPSFSLFTYNI